MVHILQCGLGFGQGHISDGGTETKSSISIGKASLTPISFPISFGQYGTGRSSIAIISSGLQLAAVEHWGKKSAGNGNKIGLPPAVCDPPSCDSESKPAEI